MTVVYMNGSYIDAGEAVISVYDHGFLYGAGLFETFRTYDGNPFLFTDHMKRLFEAADALGIRMTKDVAAWREAVRETVRQNGLKDAYVRFTVTAGAEGLGLTADAYEHPNVMIMVKPLAKTSANARGKRLVSLRTKRNTPEGTLRFKSHNFLNNVLAKKELGPHPDREGLMLTREGFVAEGIVSNLFMVKRGEVVTPSIETGILPGITRAFVLQLARKIGFRTIETTFTLEDLKRADEVFLTNSVQEIVPVYQIDDQPLPEMGADSVAFRLLADYRRETERCANE